MAEPFVDFAVEGVGAGLGGDVDGGAHGVAEGGVEGRGLHLKLADGGLGGRERHAGGGAIGEGIGHAVDGELVLVVAAAIGGELGGGGVEAGLAEAEVGAVDGAGGEVDEVHGVAGELGELEDAAFIDDLAEGGVGGGEEGSGLGDLDGFGGSTDFERDVDFDVVLDADLDALAFPLLEALELAGDGVGAGGEVGQDEVARVVRFGRGGDAGVVVDDAHFGAGNDGTG